MFFMAWPTRPSNSGAAFHHLIVNSDLPTMSPVQAGANLNLTGALAVMIVADNQSIHQSIQKKIITILLYHFYEYFAEEICFLHKGQTHRKCKLLRP